MSTYKGIVRGNQVILETVPEAAEGAEATVLIEAGVDEDAEITARQKRMLQRGFPMGKVLVKERGELYARRK